MLQTVNYSRTAQRLRARVYTQLGRHDLAMGAYALALQHVPDDEDVFGYADAAIQSERFEEAAVTVERIAQEHPDKALYTNIAGALHQLANHLDTALTLHRRAVDAEPTNVDYLNNLGAVMRRLGLLDEAEQYLAQSVRLAPHHELAWLNLGNLYRWTGRVERSIYAYRRAIAIRPDFVDAHFALGCSLLQHNCWEEGWREFEWRWKSHKIVGPIHTTLPLWQGEEIAGRRIMVVTEQGSGDTLQFIRYTHQLAAEGAEIVIWAPPETAALLRRLPHIQAVSTYANELPKAEWYVPMMSLPRLLRAQVDDIPPPPYLHYDARRAQEFAQRLGPRYERLRVALAWSGNPEQLDNPYRSIPLAELAPLFALSDIRWLSIQKGPAVSEIAANNFALEDWGSQLTTFDDTAALLTQVDVVVSICSGPIHIAGAFDIPSICMLSQAADWRWCEEPSRTIWYPKTTLVRQKQLFAWQDVAERVADLLSASR